MIYSTEAKEPDMQQTEANIARAQDLYNGDWDGDGSISISVPREVAIALLTERGWDMHGGKWVADEGVAACWQMDEALRIALTADVIEVAR